MLNKLIARIRGYVDNHYATKDRPKLFQITVVLIVIIIISFIIARLRHFNLQ